MFGSLEINLADIVRVGLFLLAKQASSHPKTNPHHTSLKEKPMSVFTITRPEMTAPKANAGAKDKSQVWLNVGINLPMTKPDGTTENVFISLPFGLALDTMTKAEAKGNNTEYAHMVQAKNWLLEQLQAAGNKLDAGQATTINGLELQLRRVGEAVSVSPNENPFLASLAAKFAA